MLKMVKHFYKRIHHAKLRIRHPEVRAIVLLIIVTLFIPVIIYALAQPAAEITQLQQHAAGVGAACGTNNAGNCILSKFGSNCAATDSSCGAGLTCCYNSVPPTNTPVPPQKTQCETNGDVCVPGNLIAQSGGK